MYNTEINDLFKNTGTKNIDLLIKIREINQAIIADTTPYKLEILQRPSRNYQIDHLPSNRGIYCTQASLYYALNTIGEETTIDECIKCLGGNTPLNGNLGLIEDVNLWLGAAKNQAPPNISITLKTFHSTHINYNREGVDYDRIIQPMITSLSNGNAIMISEHPDFLEHKERNKDGFIDLHVVAITDFDFNEFRAPLFKIYDINYPIPLWVSARQFMSKFDFDYVSLHKPPLVENQ